MRILLTGVTGFLGMSLVHYFQYDHSVILYGHSRNADDARKKYSGNRIIIIDSYDTKILNELTIDAVIHLAGIAHDLKGTFSPADYYRVNFEGTKQVYQTFVDSNASKFIFLSSIKAVIDSWPSAIAEEISPEPTSDYGKSKLLAEQFIQANLIESKGVYIFRPCMIHGPGNKGNLNLLYQFVKKGIPFPLASFENKRSFLSIDNFNAIIAQFIQNHHPSGVYHLADSEPLSTLELYQLICQVIGKNDNSLRIPKLLVRAGLGLIGMQAQLKKLTENAIVSNVKILSLIKANLPVSTAEGLAKTIQSFHE
jgi:nucleoside-diphosphate-sugar epimerase